MRFRDRTDAGRRLGERLAGLAGDAPVVVGLPRGGVPVAAEIAARIGAPLDVILVRKVGAPGRAELAAGAVGEDGVTVRNLAVLDGLGLSWEEDLGAQVERERAEVLRRAEALRRGRSRLDLRGRMVIVVDDGIATGSTVVAAIRVVRGMGANRVVLAVPVAPPDALRRMEELTDEVVCLLAPARFLAVGQWFRDFRQVSDEEVRMLLKSHELNT
jgi:putative phosphoribosyl transferase